MDLALPRYAKHLIRGPSCIARVYNVDMTVECNIEHVIYIRNRNDEMTIRTVDIARNIFVSFYICISDTFVTGVCMHIMLNAHI